MTCRSMEWNWESRHELVFMVYWFLTGYPDNLVGKEQSRPQILESCYIALRPQSRASSLSPPHGEFWSWDGPRHMFHVGPQGPGLRTQFWLDVGPPWKVVALDEASAHGWSNPGEGDSRTLLTATLWLPRQQGALKGQHSSTSIGRTLPSSWPSPYASDQSGLNPTRGRVCSRYLSPRIRFGQSWPPHKQNH